MKSSLQSVIKYSIWAFIFAGATYAFAVDFTEPPCTPPTCNTDAPVNLSVNSQTKTGFLWTAGFGSSAGGYFATTLAVATTTDPVGRSLSALFNGKIGATSYCDTAGTKCTTPSDIYSSVTKPTDTAQAVYFTERFDTNLSYARTTNEYSESGVSLVSATVSWTASELEALIPAIASETRTIKGLILAGLISVTPPASANDLYYEVTVGDELESSSGAAQTLIRDVIYTPTVTGGMGIVSQNFVLMDYNDDNTFSVKATARRVNYVNLAANTRINAAFRIIGYVVQ